MTNKFVQQNGIVVEEGKIYLSVAKDLVRVEKIDHENNRMTCTNISESCKSFHRIDSAIKDSKFREERG